MTPPPALTSLLCSRQRQRREPGECAVRQSTRSMRAAPHGLPARPPHACTRQPWALTRCWRPAPPALRSTCGGASPPTRTCASQQPWPFTLKCRCAGGGALGRAGRRLRLGRCSGKLQPADTATCCVLFLCLHNLLQSYNFKTPAFTGIDQGQVGHFTQCERHAGASRGSAACTGQAGPSSAAGGTRAGALHTAERRLAVPPARCAQWCGPAPTRLAAR